MNCRAARKTEPATVVDASTDVILFDLDGEDDARKVWRGSLSEFIAANQLETDEIARVTRHLQNRGRHVIAGFVGCVSELRLAAEVV